MKLVSWNVNGLRACIQKGFLDEFEKFNADFFCLQETKLSEGQLELDLPGYHQYWYYAEKKGYSGTAVFARHKPLSVQFGIGVEELDHEGRVITLEYQEFFLVTCYTPNAQRELARIDHRMAWDEAFRSFLQNLDAQKPVILCGDLNVAHKEIDLKNPSSNRGNAGFSDQERESFQKTLDLGFTDTFRHLHPDKTGAYSWWSYMFKAREKNAGWRIDYFLISDRIRDQLYRAEIHSDILGSDHCPVSIDIDLLVNGALYTHETTGKPRVVEIENPKKTAKSSAITAKGFASILPIALLLCAAISIVTGYIRDSAPPPAETLPMEAYRDFEVVIYDDPFYIPADIIIFGYTDAQPSSNASTPVFCDNVVLGYIAEPAPAGVFDVFMRITGSTPKLDYTSDLWDIQLKPKELTTSGTGTVKPIEVYDLQVIPYFSDGSLTQPAGWLIWGDLYNNIPADFQLTILHKHVEATFSQDVTLVPYLTQVALQNLDTATLIQYLSLHPSIMETLHNLHNIPFETTPDEILTLISEYPAFHALMQRSDLVARLMDHKTEDRSFFNNILLSVAMVQEKMSVRQELMYLTRNYDTCNKTIYFKDPAADPEKISINYIFDQLLEEENMSILVRCRHEENIPEIYEFLRSRIPGLQALEKRETAVEALMNTRVFADRVSFNKGPLYKIPTILLSQSVYQEKMTPYQEALYITNTYASAAEKNQFLRIDVDTNSISTLTLFGLGLNSQKTTSFFDQASCLETMYHVYEIQRKTNTYLDEFFKRQDALEVLEYMRHQPLTNLYYYMKEGYMYRSDQQVVDRLLSDEALINEYFSSDFSRYGLFLRTQLAERPGAIDILMNMDLPTDSRMKYFPYTVLNSIYRFVPGHFSPKQEALIHLNAYNSCYAPKKSGPHSDDENLNTWTVDDLFNALKSHGYDLLTALQACSTLEAKVEAYKILREDSNILLELERYPYQIYSKIKDEALSVLNSPYQSLLEVWMHIFNIMEYK